MVMGRPSNKVERVQFTTNIEKETMLELKKKSLELGKPVNIIIEAMTKKYLEKVKLQKQLNDNTIDKIMGDLNDRFNIFY